jgi:predicted phosphodiesterase
MYQYNGKDIFAKQIDGISKFNNPVDYTNYLENASNVTRGDTSTAVKNRANILNLIHFSDIHGSQTNIERILDFNNQYFSYISDVLHTGDSTQHNYEDTNPFVNVGGNTVLNVIGNHDCWKDGATWPTPYNATATEVYEKFFAPFIASWGVTSAGTNLCYYYKDYSNGFRMIVLDGIHWDSAQLSWFESVLADAKSNSLAVIAVNHYPAQSGITKISCTFNEYTGDIDAVTPGVNQMERLPDDAFTAIDGFISTGGEFVCWLSGHSHGDYIGTVNNHTNQIQIIVSCASTSNLYSDCARKAGTKSQDLFNVFTADKRTHLVKIIRAGADVDKYMRTRKTLCVNYLTKEVISNN